nr:hypothetical protein [Tanacetum cinerariifolium]
MRLVTHGLEGYETGEKKMNEVDFISQREKEDEFVTVVVKVVHELKEIKNGILEDVEKLEWWFEQDIDDEGEEDEEDEGGSEVELPSGMVLVKRCRFFFLVTLIAFSSSKSSSTKGNVLEGGGVSSNVMLSDSSTFSTKNLHTADYTQLYDFLKYNQKEVDELKAERIAKNQDPLALMENSNNPYAFPAPHQDQSSFNQNYLQQPILNPEDITDPITAMNMALVLMAKAFKLNYSTPTNNNHRISSNPRNMQIAQPARAKGNAAGQNGNQIRCYNYKGVGHYARNCTVRPRRRDAAYLQTQLLIAQKEEAGIQLQAEEYDGCCSRFG